MSPAVHWRITMQLHQGAQPHSSDIAPLHHHNRTSQTDSSDGVVKWPEFRFKRTTAQTELLCDALWDRRLKRVVCAVASSFEPFAVRFKRKAHPSEPRRQNGSDGSGTAQTNGPKKTGWGHCCIYTIVHIYHRIFIGASPLASAMGASRVGFTLLGASQRHTV